VKQFCKLICVVTLCSASTGGNIEVNRINWQYQCQSQSQRQLKCLTANRVSCPFKSPLSLLASRLSLSMSIVGLRRTCKRLNVKWCLADAGATRKRGREGWRGGRVEGVGGTWVYWLHICHGVCCIVVYIRVQEAVATLAPWSKKCIKAKSRFVELSFGCISNACLKSVSRFFCQSESTTITISKSSRMKTRTERWHATATTSHLTQLLYTIFYLFFLFFFFGVALATR